MTDQKILKATVGIMFLLLFVGIASATVEVSFPDPAIVSLNPLVTSQIIEFQNQNLSTSSSVSLSLSSEISGVAQLSASSLVVPNRNSITISIQSGASDGSYSGFLNWNDADSLGSIPVSILVPDETVVVESDLIVFPTSKIISVKQGSQKTQNILITIPNNYPRSVTINAVNFNPGTEPILFGDLNLGIVAPGQSIQIPIVFSGEEAETGTYQTDLSILATDSEGQITIPTISLMLQVTAGVSPVTDETFSTSPTCSLSATTLNLNSTYSFTCSNTVSNLEVQPQYSEYFVGQSVETSAGIYRYDFMPIKYGETSFRAIFNYKGAPIFEAFDQSVRISSSGSIVPGTVLRFDFTPDLEVAKGNEQILIQLVDNKTGSLVTDPKIWVNALTVNKTGQTFEYGFLPDVEYEMRGSAPGYEDIVEKVSISPKDISIIVNPAIGDTTTLFNITVSVANATLELNGADVSNPYYGPLIGGINKVVARKPGHITQELNITVGTYLRVVLQNEEFKKGEEQVFVPSQNITSWKVFYKKELDTLESEEFEVGYSNNITFTPKKAGYYTISIDGKDISTYEAKGFSFKNKVLWLPVWVWLVIIAVVIILIIIIVALKGKDYEGADDSGLSYQVGDGQ